MNSIIIFGGSGYVGKNLIRTFAKRLIRFFPTYPEPPNIIIDFMIFIEFDAITT